MIELMVSMAIFIIGVLAYARVVASSGMATRVARETTLAMETAYRIVETMRAQNFSQVYRLYNSTTADDPGPGTAPGANFAVPGLLPIPGDADGMAGEIVFPTLTVGGALQLREDINDSKLGMPRDLNGDGIVDANNHSADYQRLPVLVRVRWRGVAGPGVVEIPTMLSNY